VGTSVIPQTGHLPGVSAMTAASAGIGQTYTSGGNGETGGAALLMPPHNPAMSVIATPIRILIIRSLAGADYSTIII
jgi:hypothetical protein